MTAGAIIFCMVVAIADGDTLTCLTDSREQVKVRLAEIDAPESGQAFGANSKRALSDICYRQRATVRVQTSDRYGRTVGRVTCGATDASAAMVSSGMAWVYDQYVTDRSLYAIQSEARSARRGLWGDSQPLPPWEWRGNRRQQSTTQPPITARQADRGARSSAEVRGNKKSGIYHVPGCRNYDDISAQNRVIFGSEDEARAAGYRIAKNCK